MTWRNSKDIQYLGTIAREVYLKGSPERTAKLKRLYRLIVRRQWDLGVPLIRDNGAVGQRRRYYVSVRELRKHCPELFSVTRKL